MIRGKFLLSGDPACQDVYEIRRRVFVQEQGFAAEVELDEYDKMSVYALVMDDDGAPSATGRLYINDEDQFAIGRVCVLKEQRGKHMGDLVMRMLLYRAQELNCASVTLCSQMPAVGFYTRYGFRPVGEILLEEGVPHRKMIVAKDEINLEGSCSKGGACGSCSGNCETCASQV